MKSSTRQVGISFCKGYIQLAEIDHGKEIKLIALGERETSMDFGRPPVDLNAEHPQVVTFVYELEELMKQHKVNSKGISFAIPTDPIFVNIIPVEAALQKAELSSHLHWELEQYFPESPAKEFIITSQELPSDEAAVKHMFMVAVRRGLVAFLQKVASELRLKLNILDIDHFSTEKTLRYNYPELNDKVAVLCGIQHGHLDASLVANGEMIDYRSFRVDSQEERQSAILSYMKHVKERDGVHQPSMLFLHGMSVPPELLTQLRAETKIQIAPLNSLRKLSASKKLSAPFIKESFRFAAAIGLALRTS